MSPSRAASRWDAYCLLCDTLNRCIDGNPSPLPTRPPWEEMALLSSPHFVTPAFAWAVQNVPDVPTDMREFLDAVLTLNRERNRKIEQTLVSALTIWNGESIPSVLLKGATSLATKLYPDHGIRIMGDIDVMLPPDRAEDAARLLNENGFEPISNENDFSGHHHLAPLRHRDTGIAIEIHHHVLQADCRSILPTDTVWRAVQLCSIGGVGSQCLNPTMRFIHALAHTQIQDANHKRRSFALRQMLELVMLAHHHAAELDWERIAENFRAAGHTPVLQDGVEFIVRQFGAARPAAISAPGHDPLRSVQKRLEHRFEWPGHVLANYFAFYLRFFRERPHRLLGLLLPWRVASHINENFVRLWRASKWR